MICALFFQLEVENNCHLPLATNNGQDSSGFFLRCFCPNGIRGSKSVSQKISDSCSRLKPWSKFGFVQLKIKFWFKKNTFVPGFVVPV